MDDVEQSDSWLQGLARLNRVIAATGQPLTGNLCYDHLQADFVDAPPNPILRSKRDRFRRAVEGRTKMLEVGVNGGHSAYVALTANPVLEFHGVDICEHAYVRPAVAQLQNEFPGRVFFYEGSALEVLPALPDRGQRFDLFHIDGAKRTYLEDVLNCGRILAGDSATLIMDDTQQAIVAEAWRLCTAAGVIEPHPGFPTMPDSERYHNQIGTLKPVAPQQRATLLRRQKHMRAVKPLTPEQVEQLRALVSIRDATFLSLLAYGGLRPEEALALTGANVRERTLLVDAAVSFGEPEEQKTKQPPRVVPLLAPLEQDLAELALRAGRPPATELIFPAPDGGLWRDDTYRKWRRHVFQAAAAEAGLGKITVTRTPEGRSRRYEGIVPNDLRHTYASLRLWEHASVPELAAELGSSPSMTLDTYRHVILELRDSDRRDAAEEIRKARASRAA